MSVSSFLHDRKSIIGNFGMKTLYIVEAKALPPAVGVGAGLKIP
jgi:hypothetical protein